MNDDYLQHFGQKGMSWGDRRYQYEDGSLTPLGRIHYGVGAAREQKKAAKAAAKLEAKDNRWISKNDDKITRKVAKRSQKEINSRLKDMNKELSTSMTSINSRTYINKYNQICAEVMSKNSSAYIAPSGRVVAYVAKRGELGVMTALKDPEYDMSQVKNGVWADGRKAYSKNYLEKMS